jgi:hypothetical protein
MTRLPMRHLQQSLDRAASVHPDDATLRDFRADERMVDAELEALEAAGEVITVHQRVADLYPRKTTVLPFAASAVFARQTTGHAVLFPGPNLARKGAHEVAEALRGSDHQLLVLDARNLCIFKGVRHKVGPLDWSEVRAVLAPSFVDDCPRLLAEALQRGIPVITTAASGLSPHPLVELVNEGSVDSIRDAVERCVR